MPTEGLEQLAREQGNSDAASCNTEVKIESPGTEKVRDGLDDPQGSGIRATDALEGQLGGSLAEGSIGPHSAGGAWGFSGTWIEWWLSLDTSREIGL